MQLTIHTLTTAPEESRPFLEGIQADLGLIPKLAAVIAESPTLLAAFDGLRRTVGSARLDPVHREVAGLDVGVAVDNRYGVAFHSTVLAGLDVDEAEIDAMRSDKPPKNDQLASVFALAQAVVLNRGKVTDTIVAAARTAGLSTAAILEVVAECTFAGLVGVIDNLAGHVELDNFLAPRRWKSTSDTD